MLCPSAFAALAPCGTPPSPAVPGAAGAPRCAVPATQRQQSPALAPQPSRSGAGMLRVPGEHYGLGICVIGLYFLNDLLRGARGG